MVGNVVIFENVIISNGYVNDDDENYDDNNNYNVWQAVNNNVRK